MAFLSLTTGAGGPFGDVELDIDDGGLDGGAGAGRARAAVRLELPSLLRESKDNTRKGGASPAWRDGGDGSLVSPSSVSSRLSGVQSPNAWGASPRSSGGGSLASRSPLASLQSRGGPSVHDLFCPEPRPREFFLNVALLGEDRARNAVAVAKDKGRSKLGRLGSLLGGVVGAVMSTNAAFDEAIADSVRDAVVDSVVNALKCRRWWASVTPILLPPIPGKAEWSPFVGLGEKGHFMVFRIDVVGQLPDDKPGGILPWLMKSLMGTCWSPAEGKENPEAKLAEEIASIAPDVQQALASRAQGAISARVATADAVEQYLTLFELHWSRELCAEAITTSRNREARCGVVA